MSTVPVDKQGTVGRWRAAVGTLTGCIVLTHYVCCGSNSVQLHALLQNLTDSNPAIHQFLSRSLCQALLWMVSVFPLSSPPSFSQETTVSISHTRLLLIHGPTLDFVLASPVFSVCTSSSQGHLTDGFCKDPQRLHVLLGDPLPVTLQFVKT